ncbi:MAG: hypothetical protein JRF56_22285 [Deltaproteobacteria bacterium]|nr:hypothetical protein [Deltaproteobacteria bacterium]
MYGIHFQEISVYGKGFLFQNRVFRMKAHDSYTTTASDKYNNKKREETVVIEPDGHTAREEICVLLLTDKPEDFMKFPD